MRDAALRARVPGLGFRFAKSVMLLAIVAGSGVVAVLGIDLARLAAGAEAPASAGSVRSAGGSLIICGGGAIPEEARDRFIELAGGPEARLVIVPTATRFADDPSLEERWLGVWRAKGVKSVRVLHTRSRETACDSEFCRPLAEATGVWFGGGLQENLAAPYVDTEFERQLKALLERGGVIGGTSAGAAIMTRVMITGGRREATIGRGFDLLPSAVVDQHFFWRNRLSRLQSVLAKHPGLVGFGIDERTALIVQGPVVRVVGESYVIACLPASAEAPPQIEILKRGDEANLETLLGAPERPRIAEAIDLDTATVPASAGR